MIDKDRIILFTHIPKCGGTFINKHFENSKYKYVYNCHNFLKFKFNDNKNYYKFTIIRDPVKRFCSMYTYSFNRIMLNIHRGNSEYKFINNLRSIYLKYNIYDFESFVKNFKDMYYNEFYNDHIVLKNISDGDCRSNFNGLFYPQNWFICDNAKNVLVDKIINMDNLEVELLFLFNFNTKNIKKENVSSFETIKNYDIINNVNNPSFEVKKYNLTKEDIDMINKIYQIDVKIFKTTI